MLMLLVQLDEAVAVADHGQHLILLRQRRLRWQLRPATSDNGWPDRMRAAAGGLNCCGLVFFSKVHCNVWAQAVGTSFHAGASIGMAIGVALGQLLATLRWASQLE